jgi:hypothetical protein
MDKAIESDFEAFEDQMARASKKFTRGLQSALAGVLLAFLLLSGGSASDVNIPLVGFKVPAFLAVFIFLLGSTAFGTAAAFYFFRSAGFMPVLFASIDWIYQNDELQHDMRENYRSNLHVKLSGILLKASPLNSNIYVLGLAALSAYILHVLTWWCALTYVSRIGSSANSDWLSTWWGTLAISSGFGVFLTAAPFGFAFIFGAAFLHNVRLARLRLA